MRDLLNLYTYNDLSEIFSATEILDVMLNEEFYRDIINELIETDIHSNELDQLLTITDLDIRLKQFRTEFGDDSVIELLVDNGYRHDICCLVVDKYGDELVNGNE